MEGIKEKIKNAYKALKRFISKVGTHLKIATCNNYEPTYLILTFDEKEDYLMAKNNFIDGLVKGLAIIGGAWLTIELLKIVAKKRTVYDCPVCKYGVEFGTIKCPNCKSHLLWPNDPEHPDHEKISN